MKLRDRSAIVTGAGQGLGEAIARRLAREGCRLVLGDVRAGPVADLAAALKDEHGRDEFLGIGCDVTEEAQVQAMVAAAVDRFGGLDVFVANAGILISGPLAEFNAADWRRVIEVNLVGQMLCMKHALPVMARAGGGSFIQINSKSGKKGSFRNSAYAASKFGGIGLVQSAALEVAAAGVRVNAVCPGNLLDSPLWRDSLVAQYARNQELSEDEVRHKYVDQVPMGRGCTYEDVCNVVVFLAGDESSYLTGQAINVTGGQEMR